MKVLEGLISRWITRLYCIFATFPTRGPRGLLCYVRQPRPSLLSGRNPMALPGTRGGVGASLTFLIQKNTTFFHLPAKPLEWVRTFHTSFPVLCTVSSPLWNARSYNVASSLANLHSIALHTARLAVVGPRLWAPLRMRTRVCAVAPPQPTPPLTFMPTLTSEMSPCQLWLIYTINIRWVSRFANFPFRGKTRVGGKAAFSQQRVSQVRTQDWKGLFPQKSSPGTLYCCCCFDTLLIPLKGRRRGHGHLLSYILSATSVSVPGNYWRLGFGVHAVTPVPPWFQTVRQQVSPWPPGKPLGREEYIVQVRRKKDSLLALLYLPNIHLQICFYWWKDCLVLSVHCPSALRQLVNFFIESHRLCIKNCRGYV